MAAARRHVAVIGCGRGELVIALALAGPTDVVAGFDPDPTAIATARRLATQLGVVDRVTFEVAGPACLLGGPYDLVVFLPPRPFMSSKCTPEVLFGDMNDVTTVGTIEHPAPIASGSISVTAHRYEKRLSPTSMSDRVPCVARAD